jgi:Na+/phosphate symporter
LAGKVKTDTFMLIIAGLIMVVTLWTSKKAKNVVKTSLDLSRQQEGEERFGSSFLARSLVRGSINMNTAVNNILPGRIKGVIAKQFDSSKYEDKRLAMGKDAPAFDMIRASVNLVVASILISLATSYKLPLSTTYVTFMVAMGSSLTDGAWGRESAVYRITGVLSVIGGWFLTAFSAFTVAFIIANIISIGGVYSVFVLIALAVYFIYRTHVISKKRSLKEADVKEFDIEEVEEDYITSKLFEKCTNSVTSSLTEISDLYGRSIRDFQAENRRDLKENVKAISHVNKKIKKLKSNIYKTVRKLQESDVDSSLYYVQVIDYLREAAHALTYITKPCFDHLDNNHTTFNPEQYKDLSVLVSQAQVLISKVVKMITSNNFDTLDELNDEITSSIESYKNIRKKHLKRLKKEKTSTQNIMLYLNILHETQNLILHTRNLLKSQRDFVQFNK